MKSRGLFVVFVIGCAILFAAFAIGWSDWWKLANRIGIMQTLIGFLGAAVTVLVTAGLLKRNKERWTALTLGSILLLGFTTLTFFSVGIFIAPLALLLLGFSLWRLLHCQTETGVC